MDEVPQNAFVRAKGIGGVKAAQFAPAQVAAAFPVERGRIQKGRAAANAEVFGRKRLGLTQAIRANRDAGEFREGRAADAALIREQQVEEGRKSLLDS